MVSSIWEQINSKRDGSNDYVKFNLVTKNGEFKPVLDHGRIVNTEYFGRVFYVLIIDSALLATHYADDVVTAGQPNFFRRRERRVTRDVIPTMCKQTRRPAVAASLRVFRIYEGLFFVSIDAIRR